MKMNQKYWPDDLLNNIAKSAKDHSFCSVNDLKCFGNLDSIDDWCVRCLARLAELLSRVADDEED